MTFNITQQLIKTSWHIK